MIHDKDFEDFEDGDDDINQEELKRISALIFAQKETLKSIEKHMAANEDHRAKHIGDQILVWDCSRLTDVETKEINYETNVHRTLGNYPSIVIETDNKYR